MINYSKYITNPSNISEICELFNHLMQDILDKSPSNKRTNLDAQEKLKLINEMNILNRIFRYWVGVNWLQIDWNDSFEGATPHQELCAFYPDMAEGSSMLSLMMKEEISSPYMNGTGKNILTIIPKYFVREELAERGGAFCYGLSEVLKNSEAEIVAPNFDVDFPEYALRLKDIKAHAENLPSYALSNLPDEIVYFRLFFEEAVESIIYSLDIKLSENSSRNIHISFVNILMGLAGLQKDGEIEYIELDHMIPMFWHVLSEEINDLIPYEDIINVTDEMMKKIKKGDQALLKSVGLKFRLARAVDEFFLFPADRYFNAVEIVWQDKMNFFNTLMQFSHNLDPSTTFDKLKKVKIEEREAFALDSINDLMDTWYNPPTCFRFHGWALEKII